jgi:signal transduction histidine kinase
MKWGRTKKAVTPSGLQDAIARRLLEQVLHESRTPLSSARHLLTALSMRASARAQKDRRLLEDALSEIARLERYLRDAELVIRPTGHGSNRERINDLISLAVRELNASEKVLIDLVGDASKAVAPWPLSVAIENVLRNAFRAAEGGVVRLTGSVSRGMLVVRIVDEGIGMPAEVLSRLGQPNFSAWERGPRRGMGVYVAKTVIEAHGGRIAFESVVGSGTTATITIPLQSASSTTSK